MALPLGERDGATRHGQPLRRQPDGLGLGLAVHARGPAGPNRTGLVLCHYDCAVPSALGVPVITA